jgi:hypothetical protein
MVEVACPEACEENRKTKQKNERKAAANRLADENSDEPIKQKLRNDIFDNKTLIEIDFQFRVQGFKHN